MAPPPKDPAETEDFPTALRRARSAVDLLAQLKIPPTPSRFKVAYRHQEGDIADLSLAMNRLLTHDTLNAQTIDELYLQFFGATIEEAELRQASARIEQTVTEVVEYIDTAGTAAAHYSTVLSHFSEEDEIASSAELSEAIATILDETGRMAQSNRWLESKLQISAKEIQILRKHLDTLEREATIDALTGVSNRRNFDQSLRSLIAQCSRETRPLSLMMVDIDHFKGFNDRHGHQLGDQVLRLVARYMTECVEGQDRLARYGGEEFSLILPDRDLGQAIEHAERIRAHVASKKVVNRKTGASLGQLTISIGVAEYRPGESGGELVHRADEALYLAKKQGRNLVVGEDRLPARI